ncbi:MAG: hypothetical protein KF883_05355 [Thermomicrobiales bacterium]|nr:hypothetical protein [Thermomicrobiales bacterium]
MRRQVQARLTRRLVQAHYADAISLTMLKREQNRILAELDQMTRRIDAHHGEYAAG